MRILLFFVIIHEVFSYPKWFHNYKIKHGRTYTPEQEYHAYNILYPKKYHIDNSKYDNLVLELNEHSDKNRSFINKHIERRRHAYRKAYNVKHKLHSPESFDWRTHNYVTTPLVQGTCGGCFAFAAVGHLEFWYKKKTGRIRPLSVQQALDCSGPESEACDGGLMEDVYYHSYYNPIGPVEFDTWKGEARVCKHRHSHPFVKVHSYVSMSDEYNDPIEAHLAKNILAYGPIPVAVDSTSKQFELYHSGILTKEHCGSEVDHAVLVVGFTPEYWIVKNSWGPHWGQNGYIYIERGRNACGINSYSSFATSVSI